MNEKEGAETLVVRAGSVTKTVSALEAENRQLREDLTALHSEFVDVLQYVPMWAREKWGYDVMVLRVGEKLAAALLNGEEVKRG